MNDTNNNNQQYINFTFFGDYLANIQDLPIDEQNEVIVAIVRYTSQGQTPEFSKPYLKTVFNCIKFSLDKSISSASRGQGRKSKQNQTEIKTKSNENQNEIKMKSNGNQTQNNKNIEQEQELKEKKTKKEKFETIENSKFAKDLFGDEVDTTPPANKHSLREEFNFYLAAFNHLFEARYQVTPERLTKFKTRRKNFTLTQLVASLLAMSDNDFYQGKGEQGWKASPTFHLRNDENVAKFLENGDSKQFLADAQEAIDNKWEYYTQNLYPQTKGGAYAIS